MGIFDNILSVFTGQPGIEAGQAKQADVAAQRAAATALFNQARDQGLAGLKSAATGAQGYLGPAFQQARTDIQGSVPNALAALQGGVGAGAGALTSGQTGALGSLGTAGAAFDPVAALSRGYAGAGGQASQASADALGLNGPEGYARAISSYKQSPGFQGALEQGLQGIARVANITGEGAGGNTLRAAGEYSTQKALEDFGNYQTRLAQREAQYNPLALQGATSAAGGQAGAATNAANVFTGTGGKLSDLYLSGGQGGANIYTGQGTSLADLASRGGLAQAGVEQSLGLNSANLLQGLAGAQANFLGQSIAPMASGIGDVAAAQVGGGQNLLNLGMQGLNLAGGLGYLPLGSNFAALQSARNPQVSRAYGT